MTGSVDVAIIGGGQAGLSVAYFLRRTSHSFLVLDAEEEPGGAWRHAWRSLRLFSPAHASSLSGWQMPATHNGFPTRDDVIDYLTRYEQRYQVPVVRPVWVEAVERDRDALIVHSRERTWSVRVVVSATGTRRAPVVPPYPGRKLFSGMQIHSANNERSEPFAGRRILIVGGGSSGAQILAEVSSVAETIWVTERPPRFLPDAVDGSVLFRRASDRWRAREEGAPLPSSDPSLGDIVMVPPVVEARARGVLIARPRFDRFTETGVVWPDGTSSDIDAVIWCTGFGPSLSHLAPLGILEGGRVRVQGTRSVAEERLWLLGYGDWTGYASATLIGVGRTARSTAEEIDAYLAADR